MTESKINWEEFFRTDSTEEIDTKLDLYMQDLIDTDKDEIENKLENIISMFLDTVLKIHAEALEEACCIRCWAYYSAISVSNRLSVFLWGIVLENIISMEVATKLNIDAAKKYVRMLKLYVTDDDNVN